MNPSFPKRRTLMSWILASTLAFFALPATAQTVIGGDTIDVSAMLDVQASDKGVLLPRLSTAQRNAMPLPAFGLLVFNTTLQCVEINLGTPDAPVWKCLSTSQGTLDLSALDTAYWNRKLNPGDTLSLSNRLDKVGLPQSDNNPGNILYWNGSTWVRLPPGLPGQQLSLSPQGIPVWTGATFPVVSTLPATNLSYDFNGGVPVFRVEVGGNVSSDGGGLLLGRGVVCGTDDNPTFPSASKSFQTNGLSGAGTYTGGISGLSPGTTYKCRAYAVNSSGIVYGEQQTFTTSPQGTVSGLNCAGASLSAELVAGKSCNGVILTVAYTGGNGGSYAGQDISSSSIEGLTASLASGTLMLGAGNLQYVLTGTTPTEGTAVFNISIGGQSCAVSQPVVPATIASLDCADAIFNVELVSGTPAYGTAVVPYTGGNGGRHTGQVIASAGVTGLTATLLPGNFAEGAGTLVYAISGIPLNPGTASFVLNIGGQSCVLTGNVQAGLFAMKNIPAGSFSMGCTPGDPNCNINETPVRTVTLSAFLMSETEVTQAQWQSVMGSNPSYFPSCAQCPVERVSWYDAVVFCNRLSEAQSLTPCYYADAGFTQVYGKSGGTWSLPNSGEVYWNPTAKGYRLPTEAEWEYAARGGSATNIYSGSNNLDEIAWYDVNSSGTTKSVKSKSPNDYGQYDMSGNVLEWVWDRYGEYPSISETNPIGPSSGDNRVLRNGSWFSINIHCRVSLRDGNNPTYRFITGGFRVAQRL